MENPLRMSLTERVTAAGRQDPAAPHAARRDAVLALALLVPSAGIAVLEHDGKPLDAVGWVLLVLGTATVAFRRAHTMPALVAMVVFIGAYHALGYHHVAPTLGSMTLLYTVAVTGTPRRALITGAVVIAGTVGANWISDAGGALATLRVSGWIAAVVMAGVHVRAHRRRAERAERTQEEVAARRVAEERLRIARDLHDLLAHSITLIGVQTSVASHVLNVAPDQLDRAAIAEALDHIADTCRTARAEVRTTLEVLRHGESVRHEEPLPDIAALPGLVRQAGARLTRHTEGARIRPAVGAAVYRITQEALTNTSRHGGPEARADVTLTAREGSLYLTVTDEGRPSAGTAGTAGSGFGLIGMEERARSVGGSLTAGPRPGGGFAVRAVLPLTARTTREDHP
ncbi:sensor histidine kinase [Streptomyces sp. NPDC002104]